MFKKIFKEYKIKLRLLKILLIFILGFLFIHENHLPCNALENYINSNDYIWGIKGGYSILQGFYRNELENSPYAGIYFIPYIGRYLMGEIDLSLSRYNLKSSKNSAMYSVSFGAGPLLYYPLLPYFQPFAGLAFKGAYLHLTADTLGREERTLKAGFIIKTGFFIHFKSGIGTRIGAEFSQNQLSDKQFKTLNLYAGASINYNQFTRSGETAENRELKKFYEVEKLFKLGEKEYNNKNLKAAKEYFSSALEIQKDHRESLEYIEKINQTEELYNRAMELFNGKKYYDAIPLLLEASKNLNQARDKLIEARAYLRVQVFALEKEGIEAYENKEYQKCIFIMKKILLIDPDNRTSRIYLPRAVKRYEALQKLK